MTTHTHHLVRRALVVAAALAAASAMAPAAASAYGWPVKPFDRQHPVRGFFGDPRIDDADHSGSLHFGVDVVAANGTPVHATQSGVVSIHPLHPTTILVTAGSRVFEYWHVIPAVRPGTHIVAYRTVLGHVEAPWAHVHFSERSSGRYVNPLRAGAMTPYADRTRPEARMATAERDGRPVSVAGLSGRVDLVAEVRDWMPLAAPAPWTGKPVMPALVRWRLVGRGVRAPWVTALDARVVLPAAGFDGVYARWTRQNKPWRAGRYRVYLAHGLDTRAFDDGLYRIVVQAIDTAGNRGVAETPVEIRNAERDTQGGR